MKRLSIASALTALALLPGMVVLWGDLVLGQGVEDAAGSRRATALSATYELTSRAVNSGGVSYTAGDNYILGGTVGQPAVGEWTGGAYSLRGGFWRPSCVAATVLVTITQSTNDVILTWAHKAANQAYVVHRDTSPYFAPSQSTRRALVTEPPYSFTDSAVLGDVNVNYTYLVRATCGATYADGARRGEFEFSLVPGTP